MSDRCSAPSAGFACARSSGGRFGRGRSPPPSVLTKGKLLGGRWFQDRSALEPCTSKERDPEAFVEARQTARICESLGQEVLASPPREAVEVAQATGNEPAVEHDVERQV